MRPSLDSYMMSMAVLASSRATCCRRAVGCVLVNSRGHVIGTGYNGPAAGMPHCIDKPCAGSQCKSGEGLELCEAIHAEQNALLQCTDVYKIESAYVTAKPCMTCTKLLLNTSCQNIFFGEDYPGDGDKLWIAGGRKKFELVSQNELTTAIKNALIATQSVGSNGKPIVASNAV